MAEKKRAQFLNSFYHKQRFEDGKLVEPDSVEIVFRNLETGKKRVQRVENPRINFYQLKEEYEDKIKHYCDYIERDKVIERTSYFHDLPVTLARLAGISEQEIYRLCKEGKGKTLNKLHQLPIFYSSDIDIQDYYKGLFLDKYDSEGFYLTKGYFDIEVDTKDHEGFPDEEEALCPVNALTYVNEENNTAYVLLLRNEKNPLIKELEDNIDEFRKEVKEEFDELYGEFEYRYLFFDTEVGLITEFFRLVNDLQPDFMLAWNQKFDIVTMINRLKHHGINPEDVICHPDFKTKKCYFNVDKRHSNPEDRNDYFECSSYSYFGDQLLFYAQLRKGLGKKESYTLNAIANEELKDEKIDYTEIGTLSELPYINYKLFVKYNIKDVLLCYKLEQKNQDVFLLYTIAHMTRTRLNKAMKKTICIKNTAYDFAQKRNLVMGNNMNIKYYEPGETDNKPETPREEMIEGALVANPNLNRAVGIKIMGTPSKYVHDLVIDYDLTSLYPSIILAFNVASSSQHGRIIIDTSSEHNYGDVEGRDLGGELLDDLSSKDYSNIAIKHHGLATLDVYLEELERMGY